MKRLSSLLAAGALTAAVLVSPVAGAASLTPQEVAGETALSTVSDLQPTPEVKSQKWFDYFKDDERVLKLEASSPSMNGRVIPLAVIPAQSSKTRLGRMLLSKTSTSVPSPTKSSGWATF